MTGKTRVVGSNAASGAGQLIEPIADKMSAFDRLPPTLRVELNYAPLDFSPLDAMRLLRRDISVHAIIAGIRATVAEVFAEQRRALSRLRVSFTRARRTSSNTKDTVRA